MNINPCFNGWNDKELNKEGSCCCNCEHQRPITAHPWNKNDWSKGPCNVQIGYGCVCPELYPNITFMERQHGMCECWEERDYDKYSSDHVIEILRKV